MSQVTYDEVNLMLKLYEIRREPRLRQARAWFLEHFRPASPEDMVKKYPQGGEEDIFIRMVISYWEMVAGIVNRGLINDELFFESNGEIWVVWDRMRSVVPVWRAAFKNPQLFLSIEETCRRLEAWRERKAPGSTAAMRQMMGQDMPKSSEV
ncbi:MAG: DUF4760 domain-containing protein [Candidatus Acidiferrum sp.]